MDKYLKVIFGTKSGTSSDLEYKIDEKIVHTLKVLIKYLLKIKML